MEWGKEFLLQKATVKVLCICTRSSGLEGVRETVEVCWEGF